jgi:hypothetical protein
VPAFHHEFDVHPGLHGQKLHITLSKSKRRQLPLPIPRPVGEYLLRLIHREQLALALLTLSRRHTHQGQRRRCQDLRHPRAQRRVARH